MLERVGSYILNENFCNNYNLARDGTGTSYTAVAAKVIYRLFSSIS